MLLLALTRPSSLPVQLLIILLMCALITCTLPSRPAEAVIKYCCPLSVSSGTWITEGGVYKLRFTSTLLEQGCQPTCGDPTFYSLDITVKLNYGVSSQPCSSLCGASDMKLAHKGNSTCNASSGFGCRKADCSPLSKQTLAYLCNNGAFNTSNSAHIVVTGVWAGGNPPPSYGSPPVSCTDCEDDWIDRKESDYHAGFGIGTWDTAATPCSVLSGVNCVCNQGGSNCT